MPNHFRSAGYRAFGAGKVFHGEYPDAWDQAFPSWCKHTPPEKFPKTAGGRGGFRDWGPVDIPVTDMGDYKVVDWVSERFHDKLQSPTFFGAGTLRPHFPLHVPRKYFELFDPEKIELPKILPDDLEDVPDRAREMSLFPDFHQMIVEEGQWVPAVHAYLACIAFADDMVGRLLTALDESPIANDTIVVLWSDHGWHLGEKLHWLKFTLWEEATRVPLIIRVPGVTEAGAQCRRAVNLVDLYPTLVELCGLPERSDLEGHSLTPLLRDPEASWSHGSLTTWGRANHSVRTDRWRYTRYDDGSQELYDHDADPNEWHNLAPDPQHASTIEEVAAMLPESDAPWAPHKKDYTKAQLACKAPK
jgi:arylsulfatase A-like enzyme